MAQNKTDARSKSKASEGALAKQRQLEAYHQPQESHLTTSQGVVVPDNHNSLRAGVRGPTLLEDFILREKLTHFDHERIPERVVNARGCGAHGYFELYKSLSQFTRADFLQESGGRTPVFVRFSNFTGERGSADTVRDLRGFAVKFYTREGNYDLVGASFPVFFIQDAMKMPDLAHAIKPQPHHGMPQASSAHDTFWDFVSLVPESTHALMWLMSGRALPRSLRMMDGFGVHTFRFVNAQGASHFVKFHWRARLGRHALCREEAQQIAGRDPDYLRRDLWEAIAAGHSPEWELGVQMVEEGRAESLGVDLLDPTKLLPEELVPVQPIGRLVLNRNPDNHFAEVEQAAFHPGHLVPGIDFTSDPLLQGRLFAYTDAQIGRLGGPNHHELPINRTVCPVHNHSRDGRHRASIPRGPAGYEPNTLATGAEFRVDGGQQGFQETPEAHASIRTRRRSTSFDEHFAQATLFWNSQSAAEKEQLIAAFQWELSQVESGAIRQRAVDNLAHVDGRLARKVAEPLGIGAPDPRAAAGRAGFREAHGLASPESSAALSMEQQPPPSPSLAIATRCVAILVAPGAEVGAMKVLQQALHDQGATTRIVAPQLGHVSTSSGQQLPVDHTFTSTASVLFDAVMVPAGGGSAEWLRHNGPAVRFVLEAYRHGKALCLIGESVQLLAGIDPQAGVSGVVFGSNDPATRLQMAQEFIRAIARHRHWGRPALSVDPA
jgi:catalase